MLSLSYALEDQKWRWRVAFLFILAHMIVFILPFFSVTFLFMDILTHGEARGKPPNQALAECCVLILLIVIFFSELITMFVKPFSTLVFTEVILLGIYVFISHKSEGLFNYFNIINMNDISHTHVPLVILSFCTVVKIACAFSSQPMESAKKTLFKREPGKIV